MQASHHVSHSAIMDMGLRSAVVNVVGWRHSALPIVLLLASLCGAHQAVAGTTTTTAVQANQSRQAADAESQAAQGNFADAARRYEALAAQSGGAAKDRFLVKAAWFTIQANDVAKSQSLLDAAGKSLSGADAALRNVTAAAIALRGNQPERALSMLDQILLPLPDDIADDILQVRTQALFALGRVAPAVNTATERERLLKSNPELQQNRLLIWNGLKQAAAAGRDLTPPPGANRTVAGWLELARIYAGTQRDPFAFNRALTDWRSRYPAHPGVELMATVVAPAPATTTASMANGAAHLALLLPLSGKQQAAGIAVRDGFLAAMLQQPAASRPSVVIYDSNAGVVNAYRRALSEGATFVIGPLLKEDVQTLAATQEVGVTTLALNSLPDGQTPPAALFQFSLDPEDEARQAAKRARADGFGRALVLVPGNEWGQRMQRAFTQQLQADGGTLVETHGYDPGARDYVALVKQLLAPRPGRAATTPDPAQKIAARRDDFDFIFIAAQAAQAKLLRPALRFNMPDGNVAVYSTSEAFDAEADTNGDLDGLRFGDMPWVVDRDPQLDVLHSSIARYWPTALRARSRLYAFGADACKLVDYLKAARPQLIAPIRGMTGWLAVDQAGHVRRQLSWAQIVNGQPQLLPDAMANTAH